MDALAKIVIYEKYAELNASLLRRTLPIFTPVSLIPDFAVRGLGFFLAFGFLDFLVMTMHSIKINHFRRGRPNRVPH